MGGIQNLKNLNLNNCGIKSMQKLNIVAPK